MRFDLATLYRRAIKTPRRKAIAFQQVTVPAMLASDLYASAYAPVLAEWSNAIPTIMAEYERSLAEVTTDAAPELSGIIVSTEAGVSALSIMLRLRLERWAKRIEEAQRKRWAASVKRGSGIDIGMLVGPDDVRLPLGTVIERNVALVKSVSDQARTRMSDSVFRGLSERKPARDVAAELREAVDMGKRRSLFIASDQLSKAVETLNEERRRQAGLSMWEWISSHKAHPRPEHAARDGKRYDDNATSGAHKPPEDRPGQLPYCGCTSRAVLSLDGEF
jgi:hypothetical protein